VRAGRVLGAGRYYGGCGPNSTLTVCSHYRLTAKLRRRTKEKAPPRTGPGSSVQLVFWSAEGWLPRRGNSGRRESFPHVWRKKSPAHDEAGPGKFGCARRSCYEGSACETCRRDRGSSGNPREAHHLFIRSERSRASVSGPRGDRRPASTSCVRRQSLTPSGLREHS
jgi:hypothetical protein